ncbi:MAG: hypothetical protein WCX81_06915 [Monoglobales bacterium]
MKTAFVDTSEKASIWRIKPKIYDFGKENQLYVFPGKCREKRLAKVLSKCDVKIIDENCSDEFSRKVYLKAILQIMKEKDIENLTFCFKNPSEYLDIFLSLFKREIPFSVTFSMENEQLVEYFLEKYGHPITITGNVKNGLLVYGGGFFPEISDSATVLDLSGGLNGDKLEFQEFLIKNVSFPIHITSLPLLRAALNLTEKDVEDIIIKLCIIRTKSE